MITINHPHVCNMCKAPLPTWTFGKQSKVKQNVQKHSAWPLKEEPSEFDYAEYDCPYCEFKGRGRIVLVDLPNVESALVDVKEI